MLFYLMFEDKMFNNIKSIFLILIIGMMLFSSCKDDAVKPVKPVIQSPVIDKIDPINGIIGQVVRLYGKYFGAERGASYVQFADAKATEYLGWNDSLIIVRVPEKALTGQVSVVVNNKRSNFVNFTVGQNAGPPFISRVNPDQAFRGNEVTIDGSNFLNTRGESYIEFSFNDSKYKPSDNDYLAWKNTQIKFKVPLNFPKGTGTIAVYVNKQKSQDKKFTVLEQVKENPPVIDYIEPSTALVGDTIAIHGSEFTDFRKNHKGFVMLSGIKIEDLGYVDWKNELILIVVPKGAKDGKIYVSKDDLKSNEVDFKLGSVEYKAPVIDSLSNKFGKANQTIDIYGKNFGDYQGNSYINFGGSKLNRNNILNWTDNTISMQIPSDVQPGIQTIIVFVHDKPSNSYALEIIDETKKLIVENMVLIKAGTFIMGTDNDDMWANPAHQVTLTKDFYMSAYEITQKQWQKVFMGSDPSYQNGTPDNPVEQIMWESSTVPYGAIEWCNEASKLDGFEPCYTINGTTVTCDFSKNGYRLPTEAEWEYACRAGTTGDLSFTGNIDDYAWTRQNSNTEVHNVGLKLPNPWGLYDMYGNVAEWCWDWLDTYSSDSQTNPTGPTKFTGNGKVVRGGSAFSTVNEIKSWAREDFNPVMRERKVGFRVVRNK